MGKIGNNQVGYKQGSKEKDAGSRKKENTYNIPMSVLNMMNAVLGSGILGLANAVSNVGIVLFMLVCVRTLKTFIKVSKATKTIRIFYFLVICY